MPESEQPFEEQPDGGVKKFQWSFSFGADPEKLREAIEAAREAGIEPQIEVKKHVIEWNPFEHAERLERSDPLRTIRRVLAWFPPLLLFGLIAGGIYVGFRDPSVGPYWGGIMGAVLGGFMYEMLRPRGWFK